MIRFARRAVSRVVRIVLGIVSGRWPRFAFRTAAACAFLARQPDRTRLQLAFPDRSPDELRRIARGMAATEMRTDVALESAVRFGLAPLRRLVLPSERLAAMRGPAIMGTFHIGSVAALLVVNERFPEEVFVMRRHESTIARRGIPIDVSEEGETAGARAFYQAVQKLRAGGMGVLALDPLHGTRVAVPFLGRTLRLARSSFALARLTGAPILPMVTRWRESDVEVIVGEALSTNDADVERGLAIAAARWLEKYLHEHPEEISARILDLLS